MAHLRPYIFSEDARKQAEFYARALKGEILQVETFAKLPGGQVKEEDKEKVMHLRLQAAGQVFYMSDLLDKSLSRGNGMDLVLEFDGEEEARQAFEALAQGGQVVMPFAKQFWGAFSGMVVDPFGIRWQIMAEG